MLYPRQFLQPYYITVTGLTDILKRYIYKFEYHRSEIKRLKWHEKDFLFEHMRMLTKDNDNYKIDLLNIPEAKDFVFYMLILIYTSERQTIDFSMSAHDAFGKISKKRKIQHKDFFYRCLTEWTNLLNSGKGPYMTVLKPLYQTKKKELEALK